jgi:NADH:ubiquinone oxidoreductase subunit 3 (subunit A)
MGDAMTETIPLLMGVFMGLVGVLIGMAFAFYIDGRVQQNRNKRDDYESAGS